MDNNRQLIDNNTFSMKTHFLSFADIQFMQYPIKYTYLGNMSNTFLYIKQHADYFILLELNHEMFWNNYTIKYNYFKDQY